MNLKELKIGQSAVIKAVGGEGALRQHFLDMGVIPGTEVTVIKYAPLGDPVELQIHGYELTLRLADAEKIEIEPIKERTNKHERIKEIVSSEHPGLGEDGKYHVEGDKDKLPDGTLLTFALVGNQNCGKTTLFNQLTGANQHVGNFPGVTVDRKDGPIRDFPNTLVTDLPYAFFVAAFFPDKAALVMVLLYLLGIAVGILASLAYKNTIFRGEAVPFVMELPNYRMPGRRT